MASKDPATRRAQTKAYRGKYREKLKVAMLAWANAHRSELHAYDAAYRAARPEYGLNRSKAYLAAHRQERREYTRRYREAHPGASKAYDDSHREAIAKRQAAWRMANPHLVAAKSAKRRASTRRATPQWANHAAIRAIYQEAAQRTRDTGIPHEVDHIVPLHNAKVCGLHVEGNLQILTRAENIKKHNKFQSGQC